MNQEEIREQLNQLAEPEFLAFTSRLMPGTKNVLGVRLPALRKFAKKIVKSADWREYLREARDDSYEEIMLQGMVIGYAPCSLEELWKWTGDFVPKIDNWSVCDSFCAGLKSAKEFKKEWWDFLKPYSESGQEYDIRFAIVMYLMYFADKEYVRKVLDKIDKVDHPAYYVKMAVAWAVSICFIHCPDEVMMYLKRNRLDDWTYNKALQKIRESHCVDVVMKDLIKTMKR